MQFFLVLNIIGAVLTIAIGLLGLLTPTRAAQFTQLQALSPSGFAEFRATFGGMFVALGVCALVLNQPVVYLVVGISWIAAAAGRIVSIVADDGRTSRNVQSALLEAGVGLLMVVGQIG